METAFSQFQNQVKTWPRTQTELNSVAKSLATFLQVHFAVILSSKRGEGIGLFSTETHPSFQAGRAGLTEYLYKYFEESFPKKGQIQALSPTQVNFPWSALKPIRTLSLVGLQGGLSEGDKKFGIILCGSPSALTPYQELSLVTAGEWLTELAIIQELETEIQLRNHFLSIASHELKTPLTSIYGILQLQERMIRGEKQSEHPFPEQERHHHFLKMVIRQVERLNELIDGLLDVSRIQNGRFLVEPSETDVAKLLKECVQSRLTVLADEGGVKLHLDSIPQLIAWVDPVRLEEVITNLVLNAIRFSPEGGVVWIRLREEGDSFRLIVRDQGPSIPIEDRERIFQPFERAPRTARMGGLGLGLFISRQIAQLHGGNVSLIESVPGKGNVFEANFPVRNPQRALA